MPLRRTYETIRHLRYSQIAGQLHHRLRPHWERPSAFFQRSVAHFEGCQWSNTPPFIAPGAQENTARTLESGHFTFLNKRKDLGWPPAEWSAPDAPRLWRYNLHYFDWLWALDYPAARMAILDWIARHPLARTQIGWESYPISLRLINWCCVCFGRFRDQTLADDEFLRTLWRSIVLQADWLVRHREFHLKGNHLFENGAALAFAGSCFAGNTAQNWLDEGVALLGREIPEQILRDGMHFERSSMYHVRLTYLLQLLLDTGVESLKRLVNSPLVSMQNALVRLCHPDGEIALFNDSAFGIYNTPHTLLGGRDQRETGTWALPDAGYYGWRGADGTYLICDAGPVGPDYLPGHAHGDIFSFELSLRGYRVIVDSGTYDYEPGPMRQFCRGTRAHNTVEVADRDQCEFWGAFRVARRGYPRDVLWQPRPSGFRLRGWHDGYRRFPGRPIHTRTFEWDTEKQLTIRDQVSSRKSIKMTSRFHLHPQCRIMRQTIDSAEVAYPAGVFRLEFSGGGKLSREDSFYCSEFGRKEPNLALSYTLTGDHSEAVVRLYELPLPRPSNLPHSTE